MGKTITHFMWGYQPHFRTEQECNAQRVFQKLDDRFAPEVFLVGILDELSEKRFPACVEPEDDFWIESSAFDDVQRIAKGIRQDYPESELMHGHPLAQQSHDAELLRRSIRDAIKQVIDANLPEPSSLSYYVSYPAKVDSYWVSVVVGLQDSVTESHYSLTVGEVEMHEYRRVSVPTSLVQAAMTEFFDSACSQLMKPDPGRCIETTDSDELLRRAADSLVRGLVWRVDQNCLEGMEALFRSCNTAASLFYEKSVGKGRIIIARKDHPAVSRKVTFLDSQRFRDGRSARKLLELASHGQALHCNSELIFGLATRPQNDDKKEDLFEIVFLDHHHWDLLHAGEVLMRVKYGEPYLPKLSQPTDKLRSDLSRLFSGITAPDKDRLISLIRAAEREPHGTMLAITDNAEVEAKRLRTQGTAVTPFVLTEELLRHLTPIDGAVLLSPQGVCFSIGTILDGLASNKGNPGRGARYNSAIRYVESSSAQCLVVVVSEDGGVDLIPDLRPAIKRTEINDAIEALASMVDADHPLPRWRYLRHLGWLEEHRFYLRQSDCDALNKLVPQLEDRLQSESDSNIWVVRSKFIVNNEMDESLFYATVDPEVV